MQLIREFNTNIAQIFSNNLPTLPKIIPDNTPEVDGEKIMDNDNSEDEICNSVSDRYRGS